MPKGSKKRRAIKLRKETANNHSSSTNSSGPQGDDHDSSDHALTEEEFSPRAALEAPPHHEPERETAVTEEASVVPVEHQTVSESELIGSATAVTSEVLDEPFAPLKDEEKSGDSEKASVVPVEHQTVSESELIGSATAVPSEVLDEPFAPLKDEEKSGEVSLHREETEVPESTSWAPVEQQIVPQTEAPMLAASEIFHKPFTPVEEKSGEVNLHHEQTEALEAVSRDAPTAETAPLLGRRTSWWNCCGLLDVFWGST